MSDITKSTDDNVRWYVARILGLVAQVKSQARGLRRYKRRVERLQRELAEAKRAPGAGIAHPLQPIFIDPNGTARFKRNAIVCHLLDQGPFDLNDIARIEFSDEDREQLAQLIGYSVDGFGSLPYVTSPVYEAADRVVREMMSNPPPSGGEAPCPASTPTAPGCPGDSRS